MDDQHLPNYLQNSSLLNKLSIQQLLQYWAIVCAVAVVLLSLVAVFTNDYISTKQDKLTYEVIPIEKLSRNIHTVIDDFISRKNHVISSKTNKELVTYLDREDLEKRFKSLIQPLSVLVTDLEGGSVVISKLQSSYDRFIHHDSAVTGSMIEILKLNERLDSSSIREK